MGKGDMIRGQMTTFQSKAALRALQVPNSPPCAFCQWWLAPSLEVILLQLNIHPDGSPAPPQSFPGEQELQSSEHGWIFGVFMVCE